MNLSLKGKTALVTGAGGGIGRGILDALTQSGAEVIGCGRRSSGELTLPAGVAYHRCDVTSREEIEELLKNIDNDFGKLDILVSNAGGNVFKGTEGCSEEDWSLNMDLNLTSHWRVAKAAAPLLRRGDNPVIQIMSSNHGYQTMKGCFPYNVTKTALMGLVRAMALDLAPSIRVLGLAPGFIETEGSEKWFRSFENPMAEREKTMAIHPLKALGTIEQIGGFSLFLSSPYAAFMTGETIIIDGGRTAVLQEV
ncbi:MAG: SDR family oxidoreductase [Spirochaetales bacterium]|nr:SDR family oxidoreductase [Spirochaetales bacterium]